MIELFHAAPLNMTVIVALVLLLLGAAVYGVWHSAYTRRLVIGTGMLLIVLVLVCAAHVLIMLCFFPRPTL